MEITAVAEARVEITKSILRKLKAVGVETAMLLTGPWGSGKTYLWKKEIEPSLADQAPLYISLFGVDTIAVLKSKLMTACLLRRARRLKDKDFKAGFENSIGLLKSAAMTVLKGADSYFGTHILAANLDPMAMVEDKLIICFDDIERVSNKLELGEVFGLINYLVESKHCNILILMNDDIVANRPQSDLTTFRQFKEKAISVYFRLPTEIEEVFDRLVDAEENPATKSFLILSKQSILHPFLKSETINFRILKRVLTTVSELHDIENITLKPEHLTFLASVIIEHDTGNMQAKGFYNFNEVVLHFKNARGTLENKGREEFLKRYFAGESYKFVDSFYDSVLTGVFDRKAIKHEINPEIKPKGSAAAFIERVRGDDLFFSDALEVGAAITEAMEIMNSSASLSAMETLNLNLCIRNLSALLGQNLPENVDVLTTSRLKRQADVCDRSLEDQHLFQLGDYPDVALKFIKEYMASLKSASSANLRANLIALILDKDSSGFYEAVSHKPDALEASYSKEVLDAISTVQLSDPRLFYSVVRLIRSELSTYRGSSVLENEVVLAMDKNFEALCVSLRRNAGHDSVALRRLELLNKN